MSLWTLAELQAIADALKQQLLDDPLGTIGSVSIAGRSVSYRSVDELTKLINYYSRELARLQRKAAGGSSSNHSLAKFS